MDNTYCRVAVMKSSLVFLLLAVLVATFGPTEAFRKRPYKYGGGMSGGGMYGGGMSGGGMYGGGMSGGGMSGGGGMYGGGMGGMYGGGMSGGGGMYGGGMFGRRCRCKRRCGWYERYAGRCPWCKHCKLHYCCPTKKWRG